MYRVFFPLSLCDWYTIMLPDQRDDPDDRHPATTEKQRVMLEEQGRCNHDTRERDMRSMLTLKL
jgi:hypothetical protein